jgi:hypothetical protein
LIVFFAWAYDEIRSLHGNVVAVGLRHGREVLRIDQWLHMSWERPLNHWIGHHDSVSDALSAYYVVMHLGMTALALVILWIEGRRYRHHRNVLIGLSVIGFAVYWLYPTAPPRLIGAGFHDSVRLALPFAYQVEASSANLYAAVPSLHMAWAVWVTVALWSITTRWWLRAIVALHPIITGITVLATGNHYTFDLLTGAALTALAYALAAAWRAVLARRRESERPDRPRAADRRRPASGGLAGRGRDDVRLAED